MSKTYIDAIRRALSRVAIEVPSLDDALWCLRTVLLGRLGRRTPMAVGAIFGGVGSRDIGEMSV